MKKRKVQDGELHEIENKRRSRVVRDKKKGERRLKPWTKKRKLRALLPVCLIAIFGVAIFALGSFGNVASNVVDDGFVTVSYPLPNDASTPLDHSALENIGYMNTRFKGQTNWYSEMHGTTVAAGVSQSVNTFKQYANNALIMADVTSSSLVNAARQFCYYGDEVMWRNGTSYTANSFDEMNSINWKTGEPYAHMTITDFKTRNGLPGTELFVYVINEETLIDASEVIDNGDGTYTQSYVLDPARDKAPAHYVNQMKFTGGLTGLPEFSYIHLTYTFDSTWQVLSADIDEAYKAEMVITVNCTSAFHTDYTYNTPQAQSPAFEGYFKQYVGKGITDGEIPATVDAMGCITSAFLSEPVSLELSLSVNGNDVSGLIYFDASKLNIAAIMKGGQINLSAALADIELRAQIGEISIYLDKGTAYVSAGSLKARLSIEELIELINRYTVPSDDTPSAAPADKEESPIFAIDDPATEEPDDGFTFVAGESAVMKAKLDLSSLGIDLIIPLNFQFSLDEENRAALASADVSLVYDGVAVSVRLDDSDKEVPSLSDSEKSKFIDLIPYADGLAELFTQDALKVEFDYHGDGFSISGSVNIAIKSGLRADGNLLLTVGDAQLPVIFGFEDSVLYVSVANLKVRASVADVLALVDKLTADGDLTAESTMGLAKVIDIVLKNDLIGLLNIQESDGVLNIALKGTELLNLFGIDFALGKVELSVANGSLSASVLGASVKVTKGESVTVDKEGYVEILPYVEELIDLFTSEALAINIDYEQNDIKVAGELTVNLKGFAIAGEITLGYQEIEKTVELYFVDNTVYLAIDGLKVKASIQTILDLVAEITGESVSLEMPEIDIQSVLGKVLSLDFETLLQVSEENGKLSLKINGTELLNALGLKFELGEITAEVGVGRIDVSVFGATVAVTAGTAKTVTGLENYKDIAPLVPYVGELKDLFTSPVLKAEIGYESETFSVAGEISVALQGGIKLSGEVTLTYGEASITANLGYENGNIYLNAAGMKLQLSVSKVMELLQTVLSESDASEFDLQALLNTLLSEETLQNFAITENDGTLSVLVKGTELLKLFGIDFALGNVELSVTNGLLSASVMGASVKVTKGESVTVDKEGYVEILPYVEELINLFKSEALALNINYEQNGIKVAGDLTVNLKDFAIAGEITLGYQEIEKTVELYFVDNTVYLAINGLKVKASVQTILDLVAEITGESVSLDMPEIDIQSVLGKVLSLDFETLLQVSEENGKLSLKINGTELLNALGLKFELGEITAEIGAGGIDVSVFGATVAVTAGTAKTVTGLENYKDIAPLVPYVGELKDLFTSPVLKAEINYASEQFSVAGEISVALQGGIKFSGEITLTYGEASITANLGYEDGNIYLNTAGMKVMLSVNAVMELLQTVLSESDASEFDLQALLNTLLSEETLQNFAITENDGTLSVLVKGTELLKLFGIDFALGDVELTVANGLLSASVMGASVKVTKGESVTVDKEGYVEILPYVEELIDLFMGEALAINIGYEENGIKVAGDLTVNLKDFAIAGEITLGYQEIEKTVELYFVDNTVYLAIDGLKVKASVQTILDLVAEITGESVSLEMPEIDIESLLSKVLSLDFQTLLQLNEENGKLCLKLNGTELLNALGLAFELGEITAQVSAGKINITAFGATIAITAGTANTVTGLESYKDIAPLVPYVGELKDLFTSPVIKAEIGYESETFSVAGEISVALQGGIKLSGEITLTYDEASITANLGYENGNIYLNAAGMKVVLSVDEIFALLQNVLPNNGDSSFDLQALLNTLLSEETLENFAITESEGTLSVLVKGTELLKLFGIDFALGNVELSVTSGSLSASVLGASVKVTKGESVTVDKEGYVEVLSYVEDLIELFTGEALALNINYQQNGLKVVGDLTVQMGDFQVYGSVKLRYNGVEKLASVLFDGTQLYLAVDGLKVCVGLNDVKALIKEFAGSGTNLNLGTTIEKLLNADISQLVALSKTENKLELLIHGSELLQELGVGFKLGDINLTVENDKLHLDVLGISLAAEKGVPFTSDEVWSVLGNKAEFVNIGGLLKSIPQILNDKAISLVGTIDVIVGDTKIAVAIEQGIISWKNGLNVYLDLRLDINGTLQRIEVAIDKTAIKLAYGQIGVELAFSEFSDLEAALVKLYNQVRETADMILVSGNPLPEEIDGLMDLLKAIPTSDSLAGLPDFDNFDVETLLKELVIRAPKSKDGICSIAWNGISLELLNKSDARLAGVTVEFKGNDFSVGATLSANCYADELPAMPELDYLDKAAFENLIDYVGAAVATLAETNLQVSIAGEVLSTDTEKYPNGKKYDIKGEINYYAGSATLISLDLDGKKLWVNSDIYLSVSFELIAFAEGDQGLDLQLFILDSDGDGVLDIYASVSLLGRNSEAYAPLNLYARADELMPVLASALALLGVDNAIVTDYVLAPWLNATTTAQLRGLGNALKPLLLGLLGGETASAQAEEEGFRSFVSAIKIGEEFFTVSLPSEVLFGVKGDDLTVTIGKTNGENGARLSLISVTNIYGANGTENTSLTVAIEAKEADRPQPSFDNIFRLEGIASLLKTVANSTTHEEEVISGESVKHEYVLNKNFYITGGILLNVSLVNIDLNIRPVAFSITIDENGDVGVNVRFEYEGVKAVGVTAINGNSVVDLTGKNGMVYIKRVQTTDASQKPLAQPITVYRAMPLSNFVSDIINQMGFLFNLGDTIANALASIDGGSSGETTGAQDLGTTFQKYIKSLEYVSGETENWTLTVNGKGLMKDMDDIVVKLGTDKEGALRDLSIKAGLTASIITVNITADLRFKNPCGIMDSDMEQDVTTDVEGILWYGMSQKLENVDWSTVKYLEGEYTSVDYVLAGNVLKTQYVVISTGAKGNDPAGTLYGKLDYPSIPAEYNLLGYKIEWKTVIGENGKLPTNRIIKAAYVPLSFTLTFTSEKEAEGYTYDETIGLWVLVAEYRYGEAFELPFAETPVEKIAYFVDGAGNRYTSLDGWTTENTEFTAVWEKIVYTAVVEIDGEQTVLTGYYGATVELPAPKELVGYTFAGWTVNGEPINEVILTQNVTVKAEYQPVTVSVKLVSDVSANGFALENGKYVKTILLTYGTGAVELPTESNAGIALVAFEDDAGTLYYRVENLTEALTLYAVWEEIGYTVTFVDENGSVVKTLNAQAGEQISARVDVPAVPAKSGYTGAWNFGGATVTEDMMIYPAYTANEYTVTVVSSLPYAGFVESVNGYEKQYTYTYDGAAVSLDALEDISGYWFKGYYTEENGEGTELTSVSGITEDSTVYIWWQDNTVSVRLYSDLQFENSVFDPQKNGYYVIADFNDEYALTYTPTVEGYQQLGWWYEENGAWAPVGNVERFHGQNSVELWAVWIQNIDVVITDFSVNKTNLLITSTITYDIMGSFTGGSVVAGKSSEIFKEEPNRTVQFVVYRGNNRDGLSKGSEIVIEGNTFRKLKMECGNSGSSWNTAPYGGARITHTFTYIDASGNSVPVSTADEYCISLETFRYEFYHEDGTLYDTVDIRGVYGEEVHLGDFLPAAPEKEGYTGSWNIDPTFAVVDSGNRSSVNTNGMNDIVTLYTYRIEPTYAPNSYAVRLESAQAIGGWTQVDNKYVYDCEANYGSSVTFYCDNNVLATYTVGTKDNVFTLPTLNANYIWSSVESTTSAIMCYAQRNVDTVVYVSEIEFEYEGVSYNSFSEELTADYSLIEPDEREGYTFKGWYTNASGSWEKVTDLASVNDGRAVTYRLHALWLSDLTVTSFTASRSWGKHTASAAVSGGELIGAFANAEGVTVQTNYVFFLNNDGATGTNNRGNKLVDAQETNYASSYAFQDVKLTEKKYMHVAVQVIYTYGGETFTTDEAIQSYKF